MCERKRHTARHVASTRYSDLDGGGYPHPANRGRGVPPRHDLRLGTPPSWPEMGYRPILTWDAIAPLSWPGIRVPPPCPDLGWGYPTSAPPPTLKKTGYSFPVEVWTDKQTENSTFPHPSNAGGKKRKTSSEYILSFLLFRDRLVPRKRFLKRLIMRKVKKTGKMKQINFMSGLRNYLLTI